MNNMDGDFFSLSKFLLGDAGVEWLQVDGGLGFYGRSPFTRTIKGADTDRGSQAINASHSLPSSLHLDKEKAGVREHVTGSPFRRRGQ
jgi:hypothetical protein